MNYQFYLDKRILNEISYSNHELILIIAIMLQSRSFGMITTNYDTIITSPILLISNLTGKLDFTSSEKQAINKSFKNLLDKGVIKIIEGSVGLKNLMMLDVSHLSHKENNNFVTITIQDLSKIIERTDYTDLNKVLITFVNITSYINQNEVNSRDENKVDFARDLYAAGNAKLKEAKRIACWASVERLMNYKHSEDFNEDSHWISNKTLIKLIKHLHYIKVLATIKPQGKKIKVRDLPNHYCYYRHKEHVQQLVNKYACNVAYVTKVQNNNSDVTLRTDTVINQHMMNLRDNQQITKIGQRPIF